MLESKGVEYRYREYRKDPLSLAELRELFCKLGQSPGELLRRRDRANQELGLTGDESEDQLLESMAQHPTLLQRPIGVKGSSAVVGRPVERLLDL